MNSGMSLTTSTVRLHVVNRCHWAIFWAQKQPTTIMTVTLDLQGVLAGETMSALLEVVLRSSFSGFALSFCFFRGLDIGGGKGSIFLHIESFEAGITILVVRLEGSIGLS